MALPAAVLAVGIAAAHTVLGVIVADNVGTQDEHVVLVGALVAMAGVLTTLVGLVVVMIRRMNSMNEQVTPPGDGALHEHMATTNRELEKVGELAESNARQIEELIRRQIAHDAWERDQVWHRPRRSWRR